MRDSRFVAAHRGGRLSGTNHRKLMKWARKCSEHVLPLPGKNVDDRLTAALDIARKWENEKVPTGEAMKASRSAHAAARDYTDPVSIAVARSIGHCVATAHMADHSLGAALYALKAIKSAGKSIDKERAWQNKQLPELPDDLLRLIHRTLITKGTSLKL